MWFSLSFNHFTSNLKRISAEKLKKSFSIESDPFDIQGRTCIATCQGNKQLCVSNARAEVQQCEADKRRQNEDCMQRADTTYEICINSIGNYSAAHIKNMRSSCASNKSINQSSCGRSYRTCSASSNCKFDYRQCFKLCGGQIKATNICVRNCNKN